MKLIHFKSIDSTSTYLKKNHEKLKHMTFVSAEFQSAGHGRQNRVWNSNQNENLLFSILLKDEKLNDKFSCLSLASAVAIYNVLIKLKINNVSIKWPNDVYVNDKKIAGILLEGITLTNKIDVLVIGVGLNVNQHEFADNMNKEPTSIYNETLKKYNISFIKKKVYKEFFKMFKNIINEDYSYLSIVRNNNYLLNKEVYAEINNQKQLVKVIDINDDNSLKVLVDNEYISLSTGEMTFHV